MNSTAPNPKRWLILGVMCLALVVTGLDSLIVTVALPTIQEELKATNGQLQWVVGSYALAFASPILFAGGLVDRYGRRLGFLFGMGLLLAGSVASAVAPTAMILIIGRVGMGLGAAFIMPSTLSLIRHVFPSTERAKAMGIWVGIAALGVPLGPVLGGLLLQWFSWGAVFLVNVPIIAVAMLGCVVLIPESKHDGHPGLDYLGFLLSVVGLLAIVYGIIEAPENGWGSPLTIGLIAFGLLVLAAFVAWERRTRTPLLDPSVLRLRRFSGPLLTISTFTFAMYGTLFAVMLYLQFSLGYGPLKAGLHLLAMCTMLFSAPLGTQLPQRIGLAAVSSTGLFLVACSLGLLAIGDPPGSLRVIIAIALLGIGAGFATAPSTNSVMEAAPAEQSGAGSAAADVAFQLGGALGIAVLGSIITTGYRSGLQPLDGVDPAVSDAATESLGGAVAAAQGLPQLQEEMVLTMVRSSFHDGMSVALFVGAAICLAGAVVAFGILPRNPSAPHGQPAGADEDAHSNQ